MRYTDEDLLGMSFLDLIKLREENKSKEAQNRLAPFEHRAFVKYATEEDGPGMGALLAGSALPYYLAKRLSGNNFGARSDPSMEQVGQGFSGFGEGLKEWGKRKKNKLAELFGAEESGLSRPVGLKEKQQAFINKLRMVPREQQLQFMAEQLSTGIPDTEVRHQLPIELNEPEPLADMLYAQRKKREAISRRPL